MFQDYVLCVILKLLKYILVQNYQINERDAPIKVETYQ